YAITPRWESRQLGIYVPYVRTKLHNRDNLGLTLRLGPVFVGSSNMGSLLFNEKLPAVDVHAGVKFGITYGKKSKLLNKLEKIAQPNKRSDIRSDGPAKFYLDDARMRAFDSLLNLSQMPQARVPVDSIPMAAPAPAPLPPSPAMAPPQVVNVVVNNYLAPAPVVSPDSLRVRQVRDSIIVENMVPRQAVVRPALSPSSANDSLLARRDREVNYLIGRLAELELDRKELQAQRTTDSVAIDALMRERERMEERLKSLTEQWKQFEERYRQQVVPTPPEEEEKKDSWFKRLFNKKDTTGTPAAVGATGMAIPPRSPAETLYVAMPPMPAAVAPRDQVSAESRAYINELRRMERNNDVMNREMAMLRKQMMQHTASQMEISAANLAAVSNTARTGQVQRDTVWRTDTVWMSDAAGRVPDRLKDDPAGSPRQFAPLIRTMPDTLIIYDMVFISAGPVQSVSAPRPANADTVQRAITTRGVSLPRKGSVYFASGSTSLSLTARELLQNMALDLANRAPAYLLQLVGYTDGTGSPEVNRRLAEQRIGAVRQFLQNAGLTPAEIITDIQLAQSQGADPKSRRVAVEIRDR
ncbi:MAG TPA: OmpA family protein, partial [Phnomibacter sp.]|nr:OmpA family protein [Phnomibacter sp.]